MRRYFQIVVSAFLSCSVIFLLPTHSVAQSEAEHLSHHPELAGSAPVAPGAGQGVSTLPITTPGAAPGGPGVGAPTRSGRGTAASARRRWCGWRSCRPRGRRRHRCRCRPLRRHVARRASRRPLVRDPVHTPATSKRSFKYDALLRRSAASGRLIAELRIVSPHQPDRLQLRPWIGPWQTAVVDKAPVDPTGLVARALFANRDIELQQT